MTDNEFKPIYIPYFGIKHEPLMITPTESTRRKGQIVAFIGKQLCFFENNGLQPQIGVPIEVMITRPIHGRLNKGDPGPEPILLENGTFQYGIDWGKLLAVLIQPVEPEKHLLVAIDGFETSGSMCKTTSHGVITNGSGRISKDNAYHNKNKDGENKYKSLWLTPGRSRIVEASNVNAGITWKQPYKATIPTNVYVEKSIYDEKHGCGVRVAGLTRPEDCDYFRLFRV